MAMPGTQGSSWRTWIAPLAALVIFSAVLFVIHRELERFHMRDVVAHVRAVPAHAMLAALACAAASYCLLGAFDAAGLRYAGKPLPYRRVALASFIAYAIGNNVGAAPLTGGAVRYRMYAAARLTGPELAMVQAFCSLSSGMGLCVVVGIWLLVAPHYVADAFHLLPPWSTLIGVVLLAFVAAYGAWGCLAREALDVRGWELRPPGAKLTLLQIVLGTAELCIASAVMWTLLPSTAHIGFPAFAGMYAFSITAGVLSHVPGGLGVFEAVMLLAVPGVPADALLGRLIVYRAIYYLLPLSLAGLAFGAREIREHSRHLRRVESLLTTYMAPMAPQIIGTLVFIAGVVLLVSGATPIVNSRLAVVDRFVPLPVLETSHLIGSITGLGLLILSRALFRRVREGYRLTVLALWAGIIASILKGIDVEEAAFLAAVLAVCWLGRDSFHRTASIVDERFTPAWIAGLVGVIGAVTWIGFFAHRHVEYSNELWWTFATSADAPRMLRASLIVALAAGTFFALNLLRPARPQPHLPTAQELDRARQVIERSDETLANAALSADKVLLFAPQDDAFIMYQTSRRSWIALGDPVGEPSRYEELVWRFRELVDEHGGWTVFYQTSGERLALYVDLGLVPVKLGEEARVPLEEFTLEGGSRAALRQAHRRAERDGASFEVIPAQSVASLLPELRRISDAWLEEKATGEKGFSVGAFSDDYICQFPAAVVRCADTVVAFANLWTTQSRAELSVDLMRFGPDAPRAAMDFLFTELMLWGRAQGYRWFNLGMAPLSGLEAHPLAPSWHRIGSFVFRHGEHFYNFEGLRQYKAKFAPVWQPKYLAAPGGLLTLPRVLMDVSVLIAGSVKELVAK